MLIPSPRISVADQIAWRKYELTDQLNTKKLGPYIEKSLARIAELESPTVAVSWGRDSVVVAHLAWTVDSTIGLWWRTSSHKPGRRENPDCYTVRDHYLNQYPHPYEEIAVDLLQEIKKSTIVIHGVRADESRSRRISKNVHGVTTNRFSRPIIDWPSWAVWAYLHKHDLPVHPAYAMSKGGLFKRDHIRVHSIGGEDGINFGRREWEQIYYRDELMAALQEQI